MPLKIDDPSNLIISLRDPETSISKYVADSDREDLEEDHIDSDNLHNKSANTNCTIYRLIFIY